MLELAISLLEDEHGITADSYHILMRELCDSNDVSVEDYKKIANLTKATEGRYYLSKNWEYE